MLGTHFLFPEKAQLHGFDFVWDNKQAQNDAIWRWMIFSSATILKKDGNIDDINKDTCSDVGPRWWGKSGSFTQWMRFYFWIFKHSKRCLSCTVALPCPHFQFREVFLVNFSVSPCALQEFAVDMFFRQRWRDDRLRHNVSGSITLDYNYNNAIWLPDTYFYNARHAEFHDITVDNAYFRLHEDGSVMCSKRWVFTLTPMGRREHWFKSKRPWKTQRPLSSKRRSVSPFTVHHCRNQQALLTGVSQGTFGGDFPITEPQKICGQCEKPKRRSSILVKALAGSPTLDSLAPNDTSEDFKSQISGEFPRSPESDVDSIDL